MRWTPSGRSADIEDRRGESYSGGGRGFNMRGAGPLGLVGVVILVVLSIATGQDFLSLLTGGDGGVTTTGPQPVPDGRTPGAPAPAPDRMEEFVSFVLDDTQNTWTSLLSGRYERAKLVLFTDAVDSACGFAQSATGPFYCPADRRVYIDLGFYDELSRKFGASGEFAQAYVLAHEIGHHVQTLLGTEAKVRELQRSNPRMQNDLSVRMELQADCYAGIWGHSTDQRQLLEQGDLESGLNAAAAIGDDRIQRMGGGRVSPERFTHGSSAQRVEWFKRGLQSGSLTSCDTFR
jgi:predicted metalloprotease